MKRFSKNLTEKFKTEVSEIYEFESPPNSGINRAVLYFWRNKTPI